MYFITAAAWSRNDSRIVTAGSQDDVPETVSKLSFTRVVAFNDLHDITIGERKIDRVSVLSPCLFLCWHGNKIDEIRRARQQEFKDFCASTFTEARWHHSIIQSQIKLLQWKWGSYLEPKDYRRACKRGGGCLESKCSKVGNGKRVLSHRVTVLILMCHIINPERIHQWVFLLLFQFLQCVFKKINILTAQTNGINTKAAL